MKKFKRGKYLFGSLLVFAFVTTLLLNLKQENEIGDINNYTPIALLEDAIVYNYINDDDALVIGYYDIASKKQSDVICENGFYISSGHFFIFNGCNNDGLAIIRNDTRCNEVQRITRLCVREVILNKGNLHE